MLSVYRNMFRIKDLRSKILFTLLIFGVYRLGAAIPVPGVDLAAVEAAAAESEASGIVGLLNLFSGGALEQLSVLALGIMPYITSSIIMQLLTVVIPRLQKLQDEGEAGRKVITQWTRYGTVILAVLQSAGLTWIFHNPGTAGSGAGLSFGRDLIPNYTPGRVALIVLTFTAGTAFVMWLGELITQRGVGNGMSLIIFINIISTLPAQLTLIREDPNSTSFRFVAIITLFLLLIVGIVFIDQGQRRIPIQFSKRVRGRRVLGGQSTYIPLKVNTAGVIPVIFASSVLFFPALVSTSIPWEGMQRWVNNNILNTTSLWYIIIFFLLIVFFTYFYTAIQFDPVRQAEQIQRQGGFVPGIRPGRQTAEYIQGILSRITLPGSLYLATVAVLPSILAAFWDMQIGFSGISLLIVVGVALETMKQIESQLMMRNYEGFLA
ncbi:MAG: preprotein translocase subunit SecY [Acidimicrobiia bacterium]|nr:preprotein translocase subunit SecY [Acidimicrobiia bacterium]